MTKKIIKGVRKKKNLLSAFHVWLFFFIAHKLGSDSRTRISIVLLSPQRTEAPLTQSWPKLMQHQPKYNRGSSSLYLEHSDLGSDCVGGL